MNSDRSSQAIFFKGQHKCMTSKDLEYSAQVIQTSCFCFYGEFVCSLWSLTSSGRHPFSLYQRKSWVLINMREQINLNFWLNHPFKYDDNWPILQSLMLISYITKIQKPLLLKPHSSIQYTYISEENKASNVC